jgi:uncharacterized membrane protein
MKSKIVSLILLTVLLSSLVFALDVTISAPADLTKAKNQSSFTLTNTNSTQSYNITIKTPLVITDSAGKTITLTLSSSSFLLANSTSTQINVSHSGWPSGFAYGTFSTPIVVYQTENASNNITGNINYVSDYCINGINSTDLEITKLTDEQLDNKDAWKWNPLDNVEITVKVHNSYSDDLDVVLEYGLYNPSTREFIDLDENTVDLSIDNGKTEETTIKFQIPSDIDASENYQFYVKAYEDGREKARCIDTKDGYYSQTVQVSKKTRAVAIDKIKTDSNYVCGDTVQIRADAVNIGKDDENEVLIVAFNRELGVNVAKVLDSLDSGDSQSLNFEFKIPQNASEKKYTIDLKAYFKYDDDNSGCSNDDDIECYDKNSLDELDRTFTASISVEGCVKPSTTNVAITALPIETEVKEGKEITAKATIINTGDSTTTYVIDVDGEESFSKLVSVTPVTLTLNKGESKDVLVTLRLNDDSEGTHTFNVKAVFDNKEIKQAFTLNVAKSVGMFGFLSSIKNNWFIWIIVLINIVLIAAIILVAVKLARA